jgi:GNAT superfamily N-acetyltransferase
MLVRYPATTCTRDENFIVYKTPMRPDYWWGAYLVSREVVTRKNLLSVSREWDRQLGALADIKKKIIQWEIPSGDFTLGSTEITESAAVVNINSVLVANTTTVAAVAERTPAATSGVVIEEVITELDRSAVLGMTLADLDEDPESPATANFLQWKHDQFFEGVQRGEGRWWMLKVNGEPVANCGLFFNGETARFREVTTHPKWRRQGYARRLCQRVLAECLQDSAAREVVIVAEQNSSAERIYKSIGFVPSTVQIALVWTLRA